MARRTAAALPLALISFLVGVMVATPALAGCADHFPEEEWRIAGQTDLLTVSNAGLADGAALRFADEAGATMRLIEADLGPIDPIELCVYGGDVALDPTGLLPEGQRVHSVVFGEDGTVFIGTLESRFYTEAHAFGLSYAALWDVASQLLLDGYPEPLATTIGQWYMARMADKLPLHHSQVRSGAFFRDPGGEGIETTNWAAASQPTIYTWNPQFQESPLSDLIEYAVAREGVEVLRNPDPAQWTQIEQAWQDDLRAEALQGRSGGNDWIVGLAIVVGFVLLAAALALQRRRSKRRFKDEASPKHPVHG